MLLLYEKMSVAPHQIIYIQIIHKIHNVRQRVSDHHVI